MCKSLQEEPKKKGDKTAAKEEAKKAEPKEAAKKEGAKKDADTQASKQAELNSAMHPKNNICDFHLWQDKKKKRDEQRAADVANAEVNP